MGLATWDKRKGPSASPGDEGPLGDQLSPLRHPDDSGVAERPHPVPVACRAPHRYDGATTANTWDECHVSRRARTKYVQCN